MKSSKEVLKRFLYWKPAKRSSAGANLDFSKKNLFDLLLTGSVQNLLNNLTSAKRKRKILPDKSDDPVSNFSKKTLLPCNFFVTFPALHT